MDFDEYQKLVLRTANSDLPKREAISNFAMGLAGETGEAVDAIKKHLYHGHDMNNLKEELGDVMWYVAALSSMFGIDMEEVAEANIEKLRKRYPDGFSKERSINRVER